MHKTTILCQFGFLSPAYQPISPSILNHFWWELYQELVKDFEGDARSILSKLHHYHTQSNVAQHEVVTLTTYIANLSLTDSRKRTSRRLLSHFKEKLRLLDSLVPDTDKIPETVQQNHDLR